MLQRPLDSEVASQRVVIRMFEDLLSHWMLLWHCDSPAPLRVKLSSYSGLLVNGPRLVWGRLSIQECLHSEVIALRRFYRLEQGRYIYL